MQWLQKIFRKKAASQGIVGISFLPEGVAIAVSNLIENNQLQLIHCEFSNTKTDQDSLTVLKTWVATYKLGNYDCHLVLGIDDYQRIKIDAPAVPEAEIALAIRWKIADLLDFPADEAVIDYYPVPAFTDHQSALEVIASPQRIIKPKITQCTQSGLTLKVIDIQETVLRNLAMLLPQNERGTAVLYLQKNFGIILIQKQGIIYLTRQIAIGYERLNLATNFATDAHDNLALEIQRSLDYVESYYQIGSISALALIPWAENGQILVNNLNTNYGINAYLMNLSTLLNCSTALDYPTQSLCAPVIGATLRHLVTQHDSTTS